MRTPAIILCALLCMASRHPDRMVRSDIILNASFNRGDATTRSMVTHTPTLLNGAVVTAGNRYMTLDGTNDLLSYPDAAADAMGTEFSISAWFEPNAPGSSIGRAICGRYEATGTKRSFFSVLRYDTAGTPYQLALYDSSDWVLYFLWNATLPSSGWHHVVFTYSGAASPNEAACYVDGVALTRTTRSMDAGWVVGAGFRDSGEPIRFGAVNSVVNNPFKGNLDDCRIYNRAMTANQAAALFSEGHP